MEYAALNVIEYLSITKTERSWSEEPDVKKSKNMAIESLIERCKEDYAYREKLSVPTQLIDFVRGKKWFEQKED